MTYFDGTHLVSDTLEELHEFAQRIGLRREWFQTLPKHKFPHYDIIADWRKEIALKSGAKKVMPSEVLEISKKLKSEI